MKTTLAPEATQTILQRLAAPNLDFAKRYPGEGAGRQPAHTLYVAGDAFRRGTVREHGEAALAALAEYAPTPHDLAAVLGLDDDALADRVYARLKEKLAREPVEDLRVDFEDGYGVRPDAEEDAHVALVATEIAKDLHEGALPPFIGIRTKPLNEDVKRRSARTVDLFLTTVVAATGGALPPGFVLTLAKVTIPEQVAALADLLDALEPALALPPGAIVVEIMIEVAQAVLGADGVARVRALVDAGRGRVVAAHLGTYDLTASCNVTAAHQTMAHPVCDFAKRVMQVSLAGTGVFVSDGSTNVLPVPPHPGGAKTPEEARENRDAIVKAWSLHARDVRRSLVEGFYQGWDLHAVQLVTRYGALYAFFLESLDRAAARMRGFLARASQTPDGAGIADDAATGQALLGFFLRGVSCGAITEDEALATGLTRAELATRSFPGILAARRG